MAERYIVQPAVGLQSRVRAYELRPGDPTSRPLRVFTLDPSLRKADGSLATVDVPYEPLEPGPIGRILEVECADGDIRFAPLDLENPRILIQNGHAPSPGDPGFHQQMTYAVASNVYASFRRALGRLIAWRAGRRDGRLLLRPHVASEGANAAYDSLQQEIRFGYADDPKLPGGRVFACLSHDVIAHEMTHALIDGLRARFTIPTNPDVLGLHEGLADVVALLHRFSYRDLLLAQIRRVGADIQSSEVLTRVARQLADASKTNGRSVAELLLYNRAMEAHEIGNVLSSAIFEAFNRLLHRKTERYFRLANLRTGERMPEELIQILAEQASVLAGQFLNICIRAIDYCPPVDVELGEYLRAMITADFNLVREDPWGYRETLIDCFASHGIYPQNVIAMSEDALLWRPPSRPLPNIRDLSFDILHFNGDPSVPASSEELQRQARALGDYITNPQRCEEFGLTSPGVDFDAPAIQSIRTSRRVGPDGQVLFDLIAEVTQRRTAVDAGSGVRTKFYGGSTIVVGPRGEVRFVISKSIRNEARLQRQFEHQKSSSMWTIEKDQRFHMVDDGLRMVHRRTVAGSKA